MPIQSAARRTTGAMLVACAALFATAAGAQFTIGPDGGQLTVNSGQSSYTATFTITNSGGSTDWIDTYCTESGVVSNCQLAGDPLVMVPAYGSAQVDVTFSASQGTGTLTLEGLGFGGYDNGSYNVTVQGAAYALSITPDALTLEQPANTASSQAFTVRNLSGSQATISFATICSGALEACITPPSVTLASSATTTVNVSYGSATGGVLHLVGTVTASPTVKDSGRITVTVPASGSSYPVAVTPAAGVLGDRFNDSSYTVAFTVKNNTATTDTYDLECMPTSGTVCVSQTLSVATLMSGGSANLSVTFRINTGTTGSGSVRLVAEGQSGFGQGQYAFTAWAKVPYAVVVTPSSGSAPSRDSFTSGHTADFTIKNVGTQQRSYTLSCEPGPTITCTGQSLPSVVLNAFQFATNTVTYGTGASGSRYVDSRATSASGSAVGKWNFTVTQNPSYRVAVSPDNWPMGLASGVAASVPFTIRNPGVVANTYGITATCLWNGSSIGCTRSPASLTVQPGATGTVTVSLTAGASGTGRILVTGTQSTDAAVKDTGWVNLSLGTAQAPAVNVAEVNQGTSVGRDQCLTIALAAGAASECGDLRLAHALPTIKTLNSVRAPTLVYSSAVAHPYPLVTARVSLPAGARNPDYVEAVLRVNGVIKRTAQWRGADFGVARASRIVLGYDAFAESATSGIHPYTVEVTNVYGAVRLTTTAAGQMLIVNRAASAFGAGWWLAGLEQLLLPGSATMVWVGGDGSARTYQQVTSGVWAAAALDQPDTIKLVASEYVRYIAAITRICVRSSCCAERYGIGAAVSL